MSSPCSYTSALPQSPLSKHTKSPEFAKSAAAAPRARTDPTASPQKMAHTAANSGNTPTSALTANTAAGTTPRRSQSRTTPIATRQTAVASDRVDGPTALLLVIARKIRNCVFMTPMPAA